MNGKMRACLVFGLMSLLVSAGCTLVETEKIAEPVPADVPVYGRIEEALPDYHLTPYYAEGDYPEIFQVNGQYGFQDQAGNVLVPAEYDGAKDFYQGFGKLYQDAAEAGGERQWFYVGPTGRVVQYDNIRGFHAGHEPYVSTAQRGERFGLLNSELGEIIPMAYDLLTTARDYDTSQWVCYGKKDAQWVQFNLAEGMAYRYEPYDEARAKDYAAIVDLSQYQLAVVNDIVVVNGQADFLGARFPFALLNGLRFDIYKNGQYVETRKAELTEGHYEDELIISFGVGPDADYFAIPTGQRAYPREVIADTAYDKYALAVEDFLQSNAIERSPYVISKALHGDFTGSGQTGAIIAVADSDRLSEEKTFRDQMFDAYWTKERFAEEKLGVFSAVLYFPDAKNLTQYEVLQSAVSQESDIVDWVHFDLLTAAQLYGDEHYEAVIACHGYEYLSYTIVEL